VTGNTDSGKNLAEVIEFNLRGRKETRGRGRPDCDTGIAGLNKLSGGEKRCHGR